MTVITIKKSLNNSMLLVDHDQREMILFYYTRNPQRAGQKRAVTPLIAL
jgi:hypothetical protein